MSDDARLPGESFLAHRARLKATRQRAAEVQPDAEPVPEVATPVVEESPPKALTDTDMPPIESLTPESDFTQFLAEGVSDALRRAALRKLFHLPQFNVLDGMNDYDEDYTTFEKLGDVVTRHQRLMQAREAEARAAAERETSAQPIPDEQPAEEGSGETDVESAPAGEHPGSAASDGEPEDDGDLRA